MTRPVNENTPIHLLGSAHKRIESLARRPVPLGEIGIAHKIKVFADDEGVVAGDGAFEYGVERDMDGLVLGDVEIDVTTVSSSGIVQVQIHNETQGVDILSTRAQIDANEYHSKDAATQPVINTANADVVHGDRIRIDIDQAGTGAKGLTVTLKWYTTAGFTLQGPQGATGSTGATGPTGPQGPQGDPGGVTTWEGAWTTSTSYQTSDAVSHNGTSYVARQDHTSGATSEPGVGASWETYWMVLAEGSQASNMQYESRSSNTILGIADKGKAIDITSSITQTFEADETLGDGWWVIIRNATDEGNVTVTLDPAGTETIDGLATVRMYSGETRLITCNGAGGNFNSQLLAGGFVRFTVDDTFYVPHGITKVTVECIGGGGGGGGGRGGTTGSARNAGTGGGGGARHRVELAAAVLGNPGDSITVDVGAGGTSGGGGSSANGSNGGTGSTTTFGSLLSAYGGGPGLGGAATSSNRSGGGGGSAAEAGQVGGDNVSSRGGMAPAAPTSQDEANAVGGRGGGNYISGSAGSGEYGGGAGGHTFGGGGGAGTGGGKSLWGGGGGGAGGDIASGNTERGGGAGGSTGTYGSAGGGGAGGAVNGGAGTSGSDGDLRVCGAGGGGGGSQDSGTGGNGGNGGNPGGGAGGGGGGTSTGGNGGTGGIGECRVWYS